MYSPTMTLVWHYDTEMVMDSNGMYNVNRGDLDAHKTRRAITVLHKIFSWNKSILYKYNILMDG